MIHHFIAMSLINGSHEHDKTSLFGYYWIIVWHENDIYYCSCSVATSSSESLPNASEKPNQPKKFFFPKCDYGSVKRPL